MQRAAQSPESFRSAVRRAIAALRDTTGIPVTIGGVVGEGHTLVLSESLGMRTSAMKDLKVHYGAGVGGRTLLPLTGNEYWALIATRACIYWVLVSGLNLIVGYAGQLAIGYVALLTIGFFVGHAVASSLVAARASVGRSQATALSALGSDLADPALAAFDRFRSPDQAAELRIACAADNACPSTWPPNTYLVPMSRLWPRNRLSSSRSSESRLISSETTGSALADKRLA